jgi:N-acetylglucosaminyl-diphospho-decaprenol L-rhamnosyltransferase
VLESTVVIAAVIVTYQPMGEMLGDCLRSVLVAGEVQRIIVVDNGGGAVVPAEFADAVELLRPTRNGGFGAGANVGFRRALEAGATVVALLNDDLVVDEQWLQPLLAELAGDDRIGAAQPMLLLAGTDPMQINSLGVTIDSTGAGSDIGYGRADPDSAEPTDITLFTGGAVAFSAAFLRATNGFDERYFLYYEDVDLGLRGADLGFRYRCVPASRVHHRGSASTAGLGDRLVYLRERNRLWCAFRHQPPMTIVRAVWLSMRRVRWAPRGAHVKALAVGVALGATRFWANRVWASRARASRARLSRVRVGRHPA